MMFQERGSLIKEKEMVSEVLNNFNVDPEQAGLFANWYLPPSVSSVWMVQLI